MNTTTKKCPKCGEVKPVSCFHIDRRAIGKGITRPASYCKKCCLAVTRLYEEKSPRGALGASLRKAVVRFPTENAITITQLMEMFTTQHGKCALSGITMTWGGDKGKSKDSPRYGRWTSISMDRIDQKVGYTVNNVRLVCYRVNDMRGNMSDEQFFEWIGLIQMHVSCCREAA